MTREMNNHNSYKSNAPQQSRGVFTPIGHLPSRQSPNIHASTATWLVVRGNKYPSEPCIRMTFPLAASLARQRLPGMANFWPWYFSGDAWYRLKPSSSGMQEFFNGSLFSTTGIILSSPFLVNLLLTFITALYHVIIINISLFFIFYFAIIKLRKYITYLRRPI